MTSQLTYSQPETLAPEWTDALYLRGNWRPIPGLIAHEISYYGRLRRLTPDGPEIITPKDIGPCGYFVYRVRETRKTYQLGNLVAAAWLGPKPAGMRVRYLDGNLLNHAVPNLAYGTHKEFRADQAARAEREEANGAPTHCERGHRLAPLWTGAWGERVCRECVAKEHRLKFREKARAEREPQICAQCGTLAHGLHHTRQICDDCRERNITAARKLEALRKSTPRLYTCHDCKTEHEALKSGPLPKRCRDCRGRVREEAPPRYFTCHGCNAEHEAPRTGPLPKWCPTCKTKARNEASRLCHQRRKQNR